MTRRNERPMGDTMYITAISAFAALLLGDGALAAESAVPDAVIQVQDAAPVDSIQTRVWLDRGDDPVVQRGDQIRVYYSTSADAYAAIFRIDTDGRIALVFPQHPDADHAVVGGRDYRLIFPGAPRWRVDEDPGVGYFFMVASSEPLDFSLLGFDAGDGWDLERVGAVVYEDPYVAIDDYVAAIIPNWEAVPYSLDFLSYSVGEEHEYPRFLCYECHDFQNYSSWNPYEYPCPSYQVIVWDDPYFYPRYRYAGTRVVFARPLALRPRYAMTPRVARSGRGPIVRTRAAPPRRRAEYKEGVDPPSSSTGVKRRPSGVGSVRSLPSDRGRLRPTLRRRPLSSKLSSRAFAGAPPQVRGRGATAQRPSEPPSARLRSAARSRVVRPRAPATGSPNPPLPLRSGAIFRRPDARTRPTRPPARVAPSAASRRAPPAPAASRSSPGRPPSAGSRVGPGPRAAARRAPAVRPPVRPSPPRSTRRSGGSAPRRRGG